MDAFNGLLNDRLKLIKNDKEYLDIKAIVGDGIITALDSDGKYPIEKGDLMERELPDGSVEKYTVTRISFHEGNIDIPSHYSIEVRKDSEYKYNISDEVLDKANAEMGIRDINERFTTEEHISQLQSISNQDIIELVYNFRELKNQ